MTRTPASPSVPAGAVTDAVRRLLWLAAILVFLAGFQLFVFTTETDEWFAWTIDSRLTAAFLGAAYWSAIGLEVGAAMARSWHHARVAIPAVFTFTALTLLVTLWHLERFHLGDRFELGTQVVTWGWIAVYVIVPVAMVAVVARQRRLAAPAVPSHPLPAVVRVALAVLAIGLLGLGVALLLAPSWAADAWPWPLTVLTARAVGAWLVGLGVGAGHALVIDDAPALRPLAITGVAFVVLQAVALARYGDELTGGARTVVYVLALLLLGTVSGWALAVGRR